MYNYINARSIRQTSTPRPFLALTATIRPRRLHSPGIRTLCFSTDGLHRLPEMPSQHKSDPTPWPLREWSDSSYNSHARRQQQRYQDHWRSYFEILRQIQIRQNLWNSTDCLRPKRLWQTVPKSGDLHSATRRDLSELPLCGWNSPSLWSVGQHPPSRCTAYTWDCTHCTLKMPTSPETTTQAHSTTFPFNRG